jgi:2-keto-4-pentenoate hydratase
MNLSNEEQQLLAVIQDARANMKAVPGTDESRGVTLDVAYRIQRANRGDRVLKGYKLGLTSPAKQQQMGISTPLYGPIYMDTIYQDRLPLSDFIQPRFEPEIVGILRDDIPVGASPQSIESAIAGYFLGVDILDSIWAHYKFTAAEVAADNTSQGGFLPSQVMSLSRPQGTLTLYLNGEAKCSGNLVDLGDPVERLAWLAQAVGGLDAGMMIFFGSPAASIPAEAGALEVSDSDGRVMVAKIEQEEL